MAFMPANLPTAPMFNSDSSYKLLNAYENFVCNSIREVSEKPTSESIAASSFRCARRSYFRLRGVAPDTCIPQLSDYHMERMGDACHINIQRNLKDMLGDNWVNVGKFLKVHPMVYAGEYAITETECETQIKIYNPPLQLACDGIIYWGGEYRLIEIKTTTYKNLMQMSAPNPMHLDQIKFYATVLQLNTVFMIYQDRAYGKIKIFEVDITDEDKSNVLKKIDAIMLAVKTNIAPEKLPKNDPFCSHTMCRYYSTCQKF